MLEFVLFFIIMNHHNHHLQIFAIPLMNHPDTQTETITQDEYYSNIWDVLINFVKETTKESPKIPHAPTKKH